GSGTFYAVAPQSNEVIAIRIATGEELWRHRFDAPVSGLLLGSDSNLYVVAGNNLLRTGMGEHMDHTKPTTMVAPPKVSPRINASTGGSAVVSALSTDPAVVGQWSTTASWPLVPVHVNVLPTGKVLAWDNA